MSLEELWQLFPIILTEHRKCWKEWYGEEKTLLKQFLPKTSEINHIGSTVISFIWAKPIIDILVEIPRELDFEIIKINLLSNGYVCMYQSSNRMSFNKGYTKKMDLQKEYFTCI